jgi:putative tryptophan/tyrosine transport system substrate-binding protein
MAEAQAAKVSTIGILVSSTPALHASRDQALLQRLQALGCEEGKNIVIERRYADGKVDRLPELARELVERKPDLIVVGDARRRCR